MSNSVFLILFSVSLDFARWVWEKQSKRFHWKHTCWCWFVPYLYDWDVVITFTLKRLKKWNMPDCFLVNVNVGSSAYHCWLTLYPHILNNSCFSCLQIFAVLPTTPAVFKDTLLASHIPPIPSSQASPLQLACISLFVSGSPLDHLQIRTLLH